MRLDICRWIKKACARYPHLKLEAFYDGHKNEYYIHHGGKVIMAFSENKFFEIEPSYRLYKMFEPLIKVGLHNNLGTPNADNAMINHKIGIKII